MATIEVLTKEGTTKSWDETAFDELRQSVRGSVLRKGDETYEEARKVWNGMIDRHPAVIVRCTGAADVMAAVKFARKHSIAIAVRGGGHNVGGNAICDRGLVIDLSAMRDVRVDQSRKTARIGGGAKLGDVDHEVQAFGLALPVGVVSATGVAGLSLHGGMGFLTRKYGLTCDNLLAADVVTASGELMTVDEKNHADLLWALRGGGSFGVVTSFEFQLHPVGPEVWMGIVFYPVDRAKKVLQFFRSFMEKAPDELMGIAIYWSAPHDEPIPKDKQGAPVIVLAACWCGPMDKGEAAIRPLREVDIPVADLSGPLPYTVAQKLFDPEYPNGRRYYWKSIYLDHLNDELIDVLSSASANRPSPISSIDVWALGGAVSRVKPGHAAFFQRTSPYLLGIEANWDDPNADQANMTWVRDLFKNVQRFSSGGMYMNFPGFIEEGADVVKKSYGSNYDRLRAVKMKYDPENIFSHSLTIPK